MKHSISIVFLFILSFCLQEAQGLTCKNEGIDHCDRWDCGDTTVEPLTCPIESGKRCATEYKIDYALTPNQFQIRTFCDSGDDSDLNPNCDMTVEYASFFTSCTKYCATDNCNNIYNVVEASTTDAIQCVQCSSEDSVSGSCYQMNPEVIARTCSSSSHQLCTTVHTVVLDSSGSIAHQLVFRGCASSLTPDGCFVSSMQVHDNTNTLGTSITCSKTCSTNTCNNEVLPLSGMKGSGLKCETCLSTAGPCASYQSKTCMAGQNFCYSKVIYTDGDSYYDSGWYSGSVRIVYEERRCASSAVTSSCTNILTDIVETNIETVSCEETCSENNCNSEWPNRPRCSQCSGSFWTSSGALIQESSPAHFDWCRSKPPMPKMCPDPSYKYCYAYEKFKPDGDNEAKWGYPQEFERGCLKESSWSKCRSSKFEDKREALYCQFTCNTDDCNLGSKGNLPKGSLWTLTMATCSLIACLTQ